MQSKEPMKWLNNDIPYNLQKQLRNLGFLGAILMYLPAIILYLVWPPSKLVGHIIVWTISTAISVAVIIITIRTNSWHFSKIRFTPEGIYFYRDKVKYLPKHRFIPWGKILGFNLGKNAAILTINYNPYYLFGEAKEKTPYYFLLYGVKKNPKIKEFIERRYPFLFEQYKDILEKEIGENLKIEGSDR